MLSWITAHPALFAGIIVAGMATLYVARPYARALILGVTGAPARLARGASLRLRAESRRIDRRYKARVREHLRQEHEERLSRMAQKLDARLQVDLNRADTTLMDLRDSADAVIRSADEVDPEKLATRVVAEIQEESEDAPKAAKSSRALLSRATTQFAAAARTVRGQARILKPEARKIQGATDKLRLIERKLERHAFEMNDAADKYERLLRSDERADAAGDASIIVPWFAALIVIAIAAAGAVLNFQLVARPMAELVGDGARIAGLSLASLAAITLILLEAAAGIVLMEGIGATQLLPVFRRMRGGLTAVFAVAAGFFLVMFSVVEVALAFTREAIIALDNDVLRAALGDSAAEIAPVAALPMALLAQALLGGAIPWILAMVAIPAETVLHNTRFIVEAAWKQTLALLGFVLAAFAGVARGLSDAIMALYDFSIFPALALEAVLKPKAVAPAEALRLSAQERRATRRPTEEDAPIRRRAPLSVERVTVNGVHS